MAGRVSKNSKGYKDWHGYRLYKTSGGVLPYPEPGDEIKGRGDGTLEGGWLVHLEATANIPDIALAVEGVNYKLLTKFP